MQSEGRNPYMPMADRGIETRRTILDATRSLFFEKGYYETSYKDIATTAGVNQGLITYHFKSKDAIALVFYREITDALRERLDELFPACTDPLVLYCLRSKVLWELALSDYRLCRFVVACVCECDMGSTYEKYWLEEEGVFPELGNLGDAERSLAMPALHGAEAAMAEHILANYGSLDKDPAIDSLMFIPSRICGADQARIARACRRANDMTGTLALSVGDCLTFSIELQP